MAKMLYHSMIMFEPCWLVPMFAYVLLLFLGGLSPGASAPFVWVKVGFRWFVWVYAGCCRALGVGKTGFSFVFVGFTPGAAVLWVWVKLGFRWFLLGLRRLLPCFGCG